MSSSKATATQADEKILSSIVTNGDLSKLSPEQKVAYYRNFCERLGLDPLSQPFNLLRLNGKEILYCGRAGAQQLSKLHNVSHEIKAREVVSGCYVVTAQASTPDGRRSESIGAVPVENMKGDALCNAMMKSETKAKRRATLDLLGLGILDESETDALPMESVKSVEQPVDIVLPQETPMPTVQEEVSALEYYGAEVAKCTTKAQLDLLYRANVDEIGGDAAVIALFTARKNELEPAGQLTA